MAGSSEASDAKGQPFFCEEGGSEKRRDAGARVLWPFYFCTEGDD